MPRLPFLPPARPWASLLLAATLVLAGCAAPGTPPASPAASPAPPGGMDFTPAPYQVPVPPDAPWPMFRRDHRNTGRSTISAAYHEDQPWAFRTGKGIFSTPVVDADGTIYIGSADRNFYAINPDGTERWRFSTGEIIDSAAALHAPDPATGIAAITVPSGDGFLYHLDTNPALAQPQDRLLWAFDAAAHPGTGFNNWFEGNVALGYDGTIYAGNTNFNYYALHPDGTLAWSYPTGSNNWSQAALAPDGSLFWASNDTYVRRVDPAGQEQWTKRTLGFIAASAALGAGPEGDTLYIGSFDSTLLALDPATGETRWRYTTGDHIYSSVALGQDASGHTTAIYFGSTDGVFYALRPDGSLMWQFDTGDPIRSSPALGPAPQGEDGAIVYFGSGNGKLYALDAATGARRWSFDTTVDEPELADRNDLNGSPALGQTGVYIGGEHGFLWYVPYDYCLHHAGPRCSTDPAADLPADMAGLFYVTPGGSTLLEDPATLPAAAVITLRLVVREAGQTLDAAVCNSPVGCPAGALQVTITPEVPIRVEKSADGHYLHIIPDGFLEPGTAYTIAVQGQAYTGGLRLGNLSLGGRRLRPFSDTLAFTAQDSALPRLPLQVGPDEVTALEWTRLAVPLPPMLTSLNQIGFDSMDWLLGAVDVGEPGPDGTGRLLLWAVGAQRDANGQLVVDPQTNYLLPLSGTYRGDAFILSNQDFDMKITEVDVPFHLFELRGRLRADRTLLPAASAYAETEVLSIPNFGPYMVVAGLANNWFEKLLPVGTYVMRDGTLPATSAEGTASPAPYRRPPGVSVASLAYSPPTTQAAGQVTATLALAPGATYPSTAHKAAILLVDNATGEPVFLDYLANLSQAAGPTGDLQSITLALPPGTSLPANPEAIVILDVFPLHRQPLAEASPPPGS